MCRAVLDTASDFLLPFHPGRPVSMTEISEDICNHNRNIISFYCL